MIINCETLNKCFTILPNEYSPSLELYPENDTMFIAFNYSNIYYLKIKLDSYEDVQDLLLNSNALKKLMKISQLWPKATLNILDNQIELVNNNPVLRETNVDINCMYSPVEDTKMISPEYVCTHEVNIRSFMKLLDLCVYGDASLSGDKVTLEPRQNKLIFSNSDTIVSMDCLTLVDSSSSIQLNYDSVKFVLIFLSKLTHITCKLTVSKESAFIVNTGSCELFIVHCV